MTQLNKPVTTPSVNPVGKVESKLKPKSLLVSFEEKIAPEVAPEPSEAPRTSKEELDRMIAAQLTDRQFAPITPEGLTKNVTYVTAANGIFKVVKTAFALFTVKLTDTENTVPGLPAMEEGVQLLIPKIPFKTILQALSFYKDVNTKDKTEVSSLYFWNHNNIDLPDIPGLQSEGQLVTYVPVQENTATLSEFGDDNWVSWLRENLSVLLELHSHNTMSAFFSGTDDANENMNQFYGVWGKVEDKEPEFAFRWVCGEDKVVCSPDLLIDWPKVTLVEETHQSVKRTLTVDNSSGLIDIERDFLEQVKVENPQIVEKEELIKGPFVAVEYPADWMTQHKKKTYSYGYKNNQYGYKNRQYGYGTTAKPGTVPPATGSKEPFYEYDYDVPGVLFDDYGYDYEDAVYNAYAHDYNAPISTGRNRTSSRYSSRKNKTVNKSAHSKRKISDNRA